jgi:hypothetical protein
LIFRSKLAVQDSAGAVRPAFETIAETQLQASVSDWYVTQPDHAQISGELAAAFDSRKVPNVRQPIQQAIAMHDMGWMPYDGHFKAPHEPTCLPTGVPLSFVNTEPEMFLRAWLGSIQAAQSTGSLGGLVVSAHFARLTHPYLERGAGTPEQRAEVDAFLHREAARVDRLLPQAGLPLEEIEALIVALQFCDLASLYICSNPKAPVEFPQVIDGGKVQLSYEQGSFRMKPNLLDHVLVLEIPCVRWVNGKAEREVVPVKVQ